MKQDPKGPLSEHARAIGQSWHDRIINRFFFARNEVTWPTLISNLPA